MPKVVGKTGCLNDLNEVSRLIHDPSQVFRAGDGFRYSPPDLGALKSVGKARSVEVSNLDTDDLTLPL